MQVYEIFKQEREGEAMKHAGNLRAPDDALALHYAKEFYSRRGESIRLWVVPRATIAEITDPDLLKPPLDRSYRVPAGYKINAKLDEARRRVKAAAEERARARRAAAEAEAAATVTGDR
jgi:ring-1,2-phenylacetyl-CoA epoxidase subunit PaaB